jgi:hypothetical protein
MRAAAAVANANGAAPPHHHVYPIATATIQQGGALQVGLPAWGMNAVYWSCVISITTGSIDFNNLWFC